MTLLCLTISSGTGPREARWFVQQLGSALERELTGRGLSLDHRIVHGPELEPRSLDLVLCAELSGVADLLGTHALVHRSALRQRHARKRWFVSVSAQAFAPRASPAQLAASDVDFQTCRAGGAGGQHANRTESAVRALHRPSGLSVRVESERSQQRNRATALLRLAQALARLQHEQLAQSRSARRARALHVVRGAAIATWRCTDDALVRESGAEHAP